MTLLEKLAEAHQRALDAGRNDQESRQARAKLLREADTQRYNGREVADALGVTRQRAHQLLQEARR